MAAVLAAACRPGLDLDQQLDLASAALWRGEMDLARQLADEGARQAAREPDSVADWKFRLLDAEISLVNVEVPRAAALLAKSPPSSEAFRWVAAKHAYLRGQHRLATVSSPAHLHEALETLREARTRAEQAQAIAIVMDTEALEAQALQRLGRSGESDATLHRLIDRARAARDPYHEAVAYANLGQSRIVRNRYDEAAGYFESVLRMQDLSRQLVYSRALINAGISYARLGNFERALDVQRQVVEAHERRGHRVYLEQALGEYGTTHLFLGMYQDAVTHLTRALEIAKSAQRPDDAALWATNLASAYLEQAAAAKDPAAQQGLWDDAERMNAEAKSLGTDARNTPYLTFFDGRIHEGRGRFEAARAAYEKAGELGAADPAIQWRVAGRLGSMAFASGRREESFRHFNDALAIVDKHWAQMLRPSHRLSIQEWLIAVYRQYVDVLVTDGQVERALAVADSGRARELAQRHGVDAPTFGRPETFRRLAREMDGVLLFYWLGREKSYAWVVTDRAIKLVPLGVTSQDVETLASDYQQLTVGKLADPLRLDGSPGDKLFAGLVAPVSEWIPRGSRVIVVPDAAFGTVNLESLPMPGSPRRYWIEEVEIAVAPSFGTLLASRPRPRAAAPSVLLIGDAEETEGYPALKYASDEIDGIAKSFAGRTEVYRGRRASPAAYRAARPETFGIVHFTAHAAANRKEPLESAVILSGSDSGYKLYARDVAEQPLAAELVTISACRSAGERAYEGEGLVGFAWAFLRAGSRRVIAGLWDVDDAATARLMEKLYAEIAAGQTPGAALRRAKLAMIADGRGAKPYYWAPFQVFVGSTGRP